MNSRWQVQLVGVTTAIIRSDQFGCNRGARKELLTLIYPQRDGYTLIFRAWTTTKDGRVIWAKWFGRKAFPIWIKDKDKK